MSEEPRPAQTQLELDIQSQDRSRLNFLGLYLSLIRRQSSKYVDAFLLQLHCILNNMVINNGRLPIKVVVGSHNIIHRKMSHFDQILLCHTCYMRFSSPKEEEFLLLGICSELAAKNVFSTQIYDYFLY